MSLTSAGYTPYHCPPSPNGTRASMSRSVGERSNMVRTLPVGRVKAWAQTRPFGQELCADALHTIEADAHLGHVVLPAEQGPQPLQVTKLPTRSLPLLSATPRR